MRHARTVHFWHAMISSGFLLRAAWNSRGVAQRLGHAIYDCVKACVRVRRVANRVTAFYVSRLNKTVVCMYGPSTVYCAFVVGECLEALEEVIGAPGSRVDPDGAVEMELRGPLVSPTTYDFMAGIQWSQTPYMSDLGAFAESIYLEESDLTVLCLCDGDAAWLEVERGCIVASLDDFVREKIV